MTICSLYCSNAYRSELAAWSHCCPESKHPGGQRPGSESLPTKPAGPQASFSSQQNCPFLLELQLNCAVLSSRDQRCVLRTTLDHFCLVATTGDSGWGETCRAHRVAGNQSTKDTGLPHYLFLLQSVTKVSTVQCFLPSGCFSLFCDAGATDRKRKVKEERKKERKRKKSKRHNLLAPEITAQSGSQGILFSFQTGPRQEQKVRMDVRASQQHEHGPLQCPITTGSIAQDRAPRTCR